MRGLTGSRRMRVVTGDVLLINGYEIEASILMELVKPDNRVLWAFVKGENGDLQPVPSDETRCIWLQDSDLERTADEV